jgi:succinoglycan biosynthesis transport protein ExoP
MYPRDLPVLAGPMHTSLAAPMHGHEQTPPGLSTMQILSILWAYRRMSLLIAGVIVGMVAIACLLWPRTYQSTATLMVNFEVNDPLSGREFPTGLLGSYMSTQVELARGSEVLLPVIDRLNLIQNKAYTAGYSGKPAGLRDWAETLMRKRLLVEQGRYGSQLIYITYSAGTPREASQVANMIAEVYSEQQYQRLTGPASERAKRYTEQLAGLKSKVEAAQQQVSEFRRSSGLIDSDEKGDVSTLLLSTLEHRLLEASNARRIAEARASADQAVGSQVLGSTMIQSLKTQLALQTSQMADFRASLGSRHPQVIALQSQMNATRGALNAELNAYSGNAAAEFASASQLEQQLQKAVEEQRAGVIRVRQLQDDGSKYALELEASQSVYKRALDGYDQVMFASGGGYTNIDFVSRATPPPKASKPRVMVAMLLACMIGGALGLALPLLYELTHRRVRCRDDIERDHGIPVLAELGPIGPGGTLMTRGMA